MGMLGCFIPRGALWIENGVLMAKDTCGNPYTIGELFSSGDAGLPMSYTDDIEGYDDWTEKEYSVCGKAWALAELAFAVGNAIWEQADNIAVWNWVRNVEDDVKMDLNNRYVVEGIVQVQTLVGLKLQTGGVISYDSYAVFSAGKKSRMANMLTAYMSADAAGITADKFEAFKASWTQSFMPDLLMYALWSHILSAIGPNHASEVTAAAARDTSHECDVIDDYIPLAPYGTDPDGSGWYFGPDLSADFVDYGVGAGWGIYAGAFADVEHDVYAIAFRLEATPGGTVKRMAWSSTEGSEELLPGVDLSLTANQSDNLQSGNLDLWFMQVGTTAGQTLMQNLLGLPYSTKLSGGVDDVTNIAVPEALGAQDMGCRFDYQDGQTMKILEFHLLHNTGSPSHT